MAGTPIQIDGLLLGDSPAAIYSAPADKRLLLKQINLCNLDVSPRTVSIHTAGAAEAAEASNAIVYQATLPPGGPGSLPMSLALGPTDRILASASQPGAISFTGSGLLVDDDAAPRPTVLCRGSIPNAATLVFTASADVTVIKHIAICNVTGTQRWVSMYVDPEGGSPYQMFHQRLIPARSTLMESLSTVLGPGDGVYLEASALDALTATVSGATA